MHELLHGNGNNNKTLKTELKELNLPCTTRPRHATAVCSLNGCGVMWQRDINGATNLLRLLLAQIKGGEQSNRFRQKAVNFDTALHVAPGWRIADRRKKPRLHSDNEE